MQEVKLSDKSMEQLDKLRDGHREMFQKNGRRKRYNRLVTRTFILKELIAKELWLWENPELPTTKGEE